MGRDKQEFDMKVHKNKGNKKQRLEYCNLTKLRMLDSKKKLIFCVTVPVFLFEKHEIVIMIRNKYKSSLNCDIKRVYYRRGIAYIIQHGCIDSLKKNS